MTKISTTLLVLVASFLAVQVRAQEEVKVPDAIMERVVRHIVNSHFHRPAGKRTIYFSDKLIKPEWLPTITHTNFIVLNHDEAEESGKEFHVFYQVESEGDTYEVWFGYGKGCSLGGEIWSFRTDSTNLRISPVNGGWGTGCGHSSGSGTAN